MKVTMMFTLIIFFLFFTNSLQASPLPLEVFAKKSSYKSIKLSPDGKHLAAAVPLEGQTVLAILERKTKRPVYVFRFSSNQHVERYEWVNNERLVFTRVFRQGSKEHPVSYGQIYAGNIDGSKKAIIFGYQAGSSQIGTRLNRNKGPERSHGEILHMLPDDPEHILIEARRMDNKYDSSVRIIKLNVYNSKKKLITRTPFGNMSITVDRNGVPLIITGKDKEGIDRQLLFKDDEWDEIDKDSLLGQYHLDSPDSTGTRIYLRSHPDGETESLFTYDLATKEIQKVFQHPTSDFSSLIRRPEDNTIVGIKVMPGKLEYYYVDKKDEFAKLHKLLTKAFSGQDITITSRTKDKKEVVILAQSDKNPGDFYIFNNENKSAEFLMSKRRYIDPELMADRKPIHFQSRDGETIYGYLTLPKKPDHKVPLVTYVHGGPYGVQDYWYYDSTAQMLANNGFAVLQVNYRGSSGYGLDYEEIAYRKRSTLIQHDIIDGTHWAMTLPEIENDKACIMGWSFGGYSSLMSTLIEPELFKCSIAAAGVYDAYKQEAHADYARVDSVAAHAAEVYGEERQLLKKESPLTYIDKLKTPVFIVHGGKDKRVPPEQAYLLKTELEKRNLNYEWMFKKKEGHGFYNDKNLEEFYDRSIKFLNKYLR